MAKKVLKKAQTGTSMNNAKASALESIKGGFMESRMRDKQRVAADSLQKNINSAAAMPSMKPSEMANKMKKGGMIKRADGSMSKRGLWDNIRANKGSGKKPTSAMLKQEKKIKAQTKKK
jgi:hypothetical protein